MLRRILVICTFLFALVPDVANALSARYWRVYTTSNSGGVFAISIAVLEYHTSIGGGQAATGGTASASSTGGGFVASNAFDADPNTFWASSNPSDDWIQYDMGSGNSLDLAEVKICARNDAFSAESPAYFMLLSSDDGTTFYFRAAFVAAGWSAGSCQSFTMPTQTAFSGGFRCWRLVVTSNNSGGAHTRVGGSTARLSSSTPTDLTPSVFLIDGVSGNQPPLHLVDTDISSASVYATTDGGYPRYVVFDFGSGNTAPVTSMSFTSRNDGSFWTSESPQDGSIEYSTDCSSWTQIATFSSLSSWAQNETKTLATWTLPGGPRSRALIIQ